MTHLELLWQSKYNAPIVLSNDMDALVSRIGFIKKGNLLLCVFLSILIRDVKYVLLYDPVS